MSAQHLKHCFLLFHAHRWRNLSRLPDLKVQFHPARHLRQLCHALLFVQIRILQHPEAQAVFEFGRTTVHGKAVADAAHCCSSKFEYCSTPKLKRSSGYQLGRIKAWPCAHCLLHVATCICCRGEASALSCASFSGPHIQFVPVAMEFPSVLSSAVARAIGSV